MKARLRPTLGAQAGFTLVELLVVILIVGTLAAIAVPAFLNQRTKSQDTEAKVYAVAAQKALEVWHSEQGTYAGAGVAELAQIEKALTGARNLVIVNGAVATFDVTVDSASGAQGGGSFTIEKQANGTVVRSCANAGLGACSATNSW